MPSATLVKVTPSQPMFGAGASRPSEERNLQTLEWQLPSGERFRLETNTFQLDGKNAYATPGGPTMPMYRVLEVKKKGLIGWKTVAEAMEYDGGFAVLNALIRTTTIYRDAEAEGRGDDVLVKKRSYEHRRFGSHEYFTLAEEGPVEALTEFLGECGSVKRFVERFSAADKTPDEVLAAEKADLKAELEELRAAVRGR